MPLELSVWRIDNERVQPIAFEPLDFESRLQDILVNDISIADPNLMVIGREVKTAFDKKIDILAMNRDAHLVVLELKRDKTPRDIVAQVLDYGSWVRTLDDDDIASIFDTYQAKNLAGQVTRSIDQAFCERFGVKQMPDELNDAHELIIVASHLDPSTERIVSYLADEYNANINAVFFRCFKDDDREYLSRAWLRQPGFTELVSTQAGGIHKQGVKGDWNGEYYASYGVCPHRTWEDAVKYGYISAGGGSWYTNTLSSLSKGDRVWVNAPGYGYIGVGIVTEEVLSIHDFKVKGADGVEDYFLARPTKGSGFHTEPDKLEYMVAVNWIKTVPLDQAIKEKGFFGNQNSVAAPKAAKWGHTIQRLKQRFGIE